MTAANLFIDDAGDRVLRFVSAARNLSRLGELTDEVVAIATSGTWRRYKTAVGTAEWLECELDYFLIACELGYDDISRVIAWTREGASLAEFMDHDAGPGRRRSMEEASAAWHSPAPETLAERAQRLGWTRSGAPGRLRAAPVPRRARALQANGMTMDEHARIARGERLPARRRAELDALAERTRAELADDTERLYFIDQLRAAALRGRPRASDSQHAQWAADARRLDWDTAKLAEEWGVAKRTVQARLRKLRPAADTGQDT